MKTKLKWIVVFITAFAVVAMLIFASIRPAAAAPESQMTPAVDPMTTPTVVAPNLDTQDGLPGNSTGTVAGSDQTSSCPMINGSMGTGSGMSGMGSMSGMSGMAGMTGMNGMSGSMPMGQMNGMPMNDALANSQNGLFNWSNPWWLLGWILVFVLVIALIVLIVLGIIWLSRRIRKETPAVSG